MKSIHIFKPGRHTAMNGKTINFSEADLKASAAAYDPKLHEAPLVIGHPRQDLPAYGWTKALSFSEGGLHADPDQVNAAFEEMVETGMFKKVSASFYLPNAPGNPVPGVYYLRHVGFLGAQPPAIKGLRPVEFAAGDEGAVTIEFGDWSDRTITRVLRRLKNFMIEKFGKEDADKMIDEWDLETLTEEAMRPEPPAVAANPEYSEKETDVLTKEQIEAKERELAAREEKLKKDNAAFAEREAQQRHGVNLAYAEGLVKAGKLLPQEQAFVASFLEALENSTATTVAFGEGEKVSPRDAFCQFLEARGSHPLFKQMVPPADDKGASDANFAEGLTQHV